MKKILLTLCLSLFSCLLFAQGKTDELAIRNQLKAFLTSWNSHDFSDMEDYTTQDVEWVNVVGMWWKGRDEVQFAHQALHGSMFRDVPLEQRQASVRFITPEVAVAHVVWYYGEFTAPDGSRQGDTEDLATLVFVRRNGKWLLTAGENVAVSESARPHDPVRKMPRD